MLLEKREGALCMINHLLYKYEHVVLCSLLHDPIIFDFWYSMCPRELYETMIVPSSYAHTVIGSI
jgi:hypothetical protein